jgi:MHS family shikimate/dehydroshikimate transporter-like MFS transporter
VATDGTTADTAGTGKVVLASTFGTIVEWYDFFVYGTAAALIFGKLFFPTSDPWVGTIAALSLYAVGYLARPLGGIVFGHFGDRIGRRSMLVLSMLLMGVGTFCVGLLPTYEQIGIWAPLTLTVLRLVQAVGLGGEWGGAVLMVAERAPVRRRGLLGSLVQIGNPIGRFTATTVFALAARLPETDFLTWGWRIPFLASAILIVIGLVIRYRINESPAFERLRAARQIVRVPLAEILSKYPRETAIAVGLKITETAWVGILTVFAVDYLTRQLGMQRSFVLDTIALATFIELFVMPFSGWLSDLIGRRLMYLLGTAAGILLAFPIFWLIETRDPDMVRWAMVAGICLGQGVIFALHASFMPELFSTRVRYSGISFGFQVGAAIGGGLTPVIVSWLVRWSGGPTWPVSLFLVVLGMITFIAVLKTRETSRVSLTSPTEADAGGTTEGLPASARAAAAGSGG